MDLLFTVDNGIFSAGGVLYDKDLNQVFLLKKESSDEWVLPKGRMEPGETPIETARREIYEETGFQNTPRHLLGVQVRTDKGDPKKTKVIFWFQSLLTSKKQESGTQMKDESFTGSWMTISEAKSCIPWETDRSLLDNLI